MNNSFIDERKWRRSENRDGVSLNTVSRRRIFHRVVPDEKRNTFLLYFPLPSRNLESRDHVELFIIEQEEKWRGEETRVKRKGILQNVVAWPFLFFFFFLPPRRPEEDKDTFRHFRFVVRFIRACLPAM